MSTNLYHVSDGKAIPMQSDLYEKESDLQLLIAENPHMLVRDGENVELYTVSREQALDHAEGTYSLDILMVDDSATPVLVEVKRSTDTRSKREVVAQMLDYAHGIKQLDAATMRNNMLTYHKSHGNPLEDVQDILDNDAFWETVAENIQENRMKLIFAADKISLSLKHLIEYLDQTMPTMEVYGVELTPTKVEDAQLIKTDFVGALPKEVERYSWREWTLNRALTKFREDNPALSDGAKQLESLAEKYGMEIAAGSGQARASFSYKLAKQVVFSLQFLPNKTMVEVYNKKIAHFLGDGYSMEQIQALFADCTALAEQARAVTGGVNTCYTMEFLLQNEAFAAFEKALVEVVKLFHLRQKPKV